MAKKYEFDFEMACEGCSNAAKRNLGKIGVEEGNIQIDMAGQKVFVSTDLPSDDILAALKKTGKKAEFKGEA